MTSSAGALIAALALIGAAATALANEQPYAGSWSNGRGETLVVTKTTLQFGSDRPVRYQDLTRLADGGAFELRITSPGEINAFPGKTLLVEITGDSMTMTAYESHAELLRGGAGKSRVIWQRDSAAVAVGEK